MSTMLSRLVDIGLNVDTSGLESFISQLRDRLDGLQDRVADLENDTSGMTEDTVQDLIDSSLSNTDYVDRSDVESMIDNKAYDAVSDQVYDMVKDVVREDLDEKDFADRDHDHDDTYATIDSVDELESRVTALEGLDVLSLEDRVTALEQTDEHALMARIEALEADRSEHLRLIQELQESSSGATRFFKLAVQMLDIVRESVGR